MILPAIAILKTASAPAQDNATSLVSVIELRNYVLKPGMYDQFRSYFAKHFVQSQIDLGGYPLVGFKVKGAPDNFFWIRGFKDMGVRSSFLPAFYYGPVWKQYGAEANRMLANNDNVYLLKPLALIDGDLKDGQPVSPAKLSANKGIAVIDSYIANTKLDQLKAGFAKYYLPAMKAAGIENFTLWGSEMKKNDFPGLPVFQDSNLLVVITFYNDEHEYTAKQKSFNSGLTGDVKSEMQDIITTRNSLILYITATDALH